jgi:uncharacterized PurR-regulated membrane protein YhhQ (DUF165 family)
MLAPNYRLGVSDVPSRRHRGQRYVWFILYVATIYAANWALERYGFVSVGFGLMAPAGVFFAGLAFTFRDFLQETAGRVWVVGAILVGAALAYTISPMFAAASAAAFLVSELADFSVYTPLRERNRYGALAASNVVGSVVDSLLFLWIAFSSINGWFGLTLGKVYMIAPALVFLWIVRNSDLSQRRSSKSLA